MAIHGRQVFPASRFCSFSEVGVPGNFDSGVGDSEDRDGGILAGLLQFGYLFAAEVSPVRCEVWSSFLNLWFF